ncbi:MAG: hypothetical protein IPH12_20305 [Saprospirales bacterium]|nr:hypothetical protein [Saprospirales bacterium]
MNNRTRYFLLALYLCLPLLLHTQTSCQTPITRPLDTVICNDSNTRSIRSTTSFPFL